MQKFLTITFSVLIGLFLLFAIVSSVSSYLFERQAKQEVTNVFSTYDSYAPELVTEEDLIGLPAPVRNWLGNTALIGKEKIYAVRSKQTANMRLGADQKWMSVDIKQYMTTEDPWLLWFAKVKFAPLVHIAGKDTYADGHGQMLIKLQSLFPIVDATGDEIDQGTLVRFLGEMVWMPTAALNDYITWEEVDSNRAKATMTYKGVTATGIFTFDDRGYPIAFVADRYGDFDGEFIMYPWEIIMSDHLIVDGYPIPTTGQLTWKRETGDFHWYEFEVLEIEFNNPSLY